MAAVPFKIAMRVVNSAGQVRSIPLTVSDVTTAFALFPSGGSELALSSLPSMITDMVYTAAGTDTSQLVVYINGVDSGIRIYNGTNLATTYNRQVQNAPIPIPAGALVRFTQLT